MNITIRSMATYIVLLFLTRLMGKREVSQMTYFDYIAGITLGSIAGHMSVNRNYKWLQILPALVVFAIFHIASSALSIKSSKYRRILEDTPTVLIKNGKILEKNMLKTRVNYDELVSRLREKSAFKLSDVETAILETDGQISVQLKSDKVPLTPSDINLKTPYIGLPTVVIEDGQILADNLKSIKLTKALLMTKLAEQGVSNPSMVSLAQLDTSGKLYIDLYEDS